MVEYVSRQSWAEAFEAVIPQRKYHDGKRKRGKGQDGTTTTNPEAAGGNGSGGECGSDSGIDDEDEYDERNVETELGPDETVGSGAAPSDWSRADGGQQDIDLDEEEMVNT